MIKPSITFKWESPWPSGSVISLGVLLLPLDRIIVILFIVTAFGQVTLTICQYPPLFTCIPISLLLRLLFLTREASVIQTALSEVDALIYFQDLSNHTSMCLNLYLCNLAILKTNCVILLHPLFSLIAIHLAQFN